MSATNATTNYSFPLFIGSDKPAWLVDWNAAMTAIDAAIKQVDTDLGSVQTTVSGLSSTVAAHTSSISTITGQISTITGNLNSAIGNINTINSLIGNGTPTTTDQTLIGAINELHANQGDLATLTTTDKSSLVAAINEIAGGGGSVAASAVSYDNTGSGLTATDVQAAIDELASQSPSAGTKTVKATATANQTYAAQLTSLQSAFSALSADEKAEAYLLTGAGKKYTLSDVSGVFWQMGADNTGLACAELNIANATLKVATGSTYTDVSTQTHAYDIKLYA